MSMRKEQNIFVMMRSRRWRPTQKEQRDNSLLLRASLPEYDTLCAQAAAPCSELKAQYQEARPR